MFSFLSTPPPNICLMMRGCCLLKSFPPVSSSPWKSACLEESCLIDKGGNNTDVECHLSLEKMLHTDSKDSIWNRCSRSFQAEPLNILQRTSYFRLPIIFWSSHTSRRYRLPTKQRGCTAPLSGSSNTQAHPARTRARCPISHAPTAESALTNLPETDPP